MQIDMSKTLSLFNAWPTLEDERFEGLMLFYDRYKVQILSTLPWLASEVLGREGLRVLIAFLQQHGGTRILFRHKQHVLDEPLASLLSEKTYHEILRLCCGNTIVEVPSIGGVFQCLRRVAVQQAIYQGMAPGAVAREVGVTQRYLRSELKRLRKLNPTDGSGPRSRSFE